MTMLKNFKIEKVVKNKTSLKNKDATIKDALEMQLRHLDYAKKFNDADRKNFERLFTRTV